MRSVLCLGLLLIGGLLLPSCVSAQVTLSGTVYSDAGVTADGVARTIAVAVGTSTPGLFASTSEVTTGAWTITIPSGHGIAAGTPILVWIDNEVVDGSLLTKASTSNDVSVITGLDIYRDRLILRHEATSATSTTNTDLGFITRAQDSDIGHSTTTTGIVVQAGIELYIWTGDTFAPGGNVTIAGNGGSSDEEGSFFLASGSTYTAGGELRLAGSLAAASGVTINNATGTLRFIATTTGKTINAPLSSLGNITFDGVGGAWTFSSAATTSAFTILRGAVTAPATTLGVTGAFQNDATFNHNNGTINITGAATVALGDVLRYIAGRDTSGSAAGTGNLQVNTMAGSGNFLYVAKAGNATACSQTAGSAIGCELMVFDISSTTNPVYVAGRDVSGDATGIGNLAVNNIIIFGNYLYVAKAANATACSQTAGSAIGCELMVFDISSTTNPVYVAGRDSSGSAAGTDATTAMTNLATSTNMLFVSKTGSATACSQTAGSAVGCELMVFDISSTTNPTYTAGRDVSGSAAGTGNLAVNQIMSLGTQLFVIKTGSATACSQTAGSAIGCELMVFDISSTTNPVYVAGRDVTGSATGTGNLNVSGIFATDNVLYIGKAGDVTDCSQTVGSALGCELMVFDTSSSTNPVYVRGVDVAGSYTGRQALAINNLLVKGNYLYAVKAANALPCSQLTNQSLGCELVAFDISSSTAVRMLAGRDAGGDAIGIQSLGITALTNIGDALLIAKGGSATACSQTAGSAIGCELMVFSTSIPVQGVLMGSLVATSSLNNLRTTGFVEFRADAQTADLITIGTTTAPETLTVTGNFQNSGVFQHLERTVVFSPTTVQTVAGNLTGSSTFYRLIFSGSGTTTFGNNASTTFLNILPNAIVEAPVLLTVTDNLTNNGTFIGNGGSLETQGYLNEFLSGLSAGGSNSDAQGLNFSAFAQKDSIIYVAKAGSGTACSQVAGSAVGCELMVFDISSTTNPVYRAGRDASGNAAGTGNLAMTQVTISGNYLYVAKAANATACSQTAGSAVGCEIMVFDISSTTNPIYVAGRDASGSATGTGNIIANQIVAANNVLYVVKGGDATACSQVAGSAVGCELMVFDISSSTNPIYVAGRDVDGSSTGTQTLNTPSIALSGNSLYIAKAGSATACSQVAGSAVGCELMVFDISSTTNPIYVAGRDGTGSAAGAVSNPIQFIATNGVLLHVAKAGSATACSQVAGSATGCEYMIFNISSTTNPIYVAGRDTTGNAAGTGNLTANMVAASGTQAYLTKAGNATACSQAAGSALGCEVMMFDVSSSTNPTYVRGRDSESAVDGTSLIGVQSLLIAGETLLIGKAADAVSCELIAGRRSGCELSLYKLPTNLEGTFSGISRLATVTANGLTQLKAEALTANVIVASSSQFTAPTTSLSISGNLIINGSFAHNNGEVVLNGTNQQVLTSATTTFYDFTQVATTAATTTFSSNAPFVILNNLTLQGAPTSSPLRLRSASTSVQWRIDPWSSTTVSLSFLDIQDANNISATATPLVCGVGCVDSGNNTNWVVGDFAPVWNSSDWVLYDSITIEQEYIDNDLTDFPVYINMSDLSPQFWNTVSASGGDIRIMTDDKTEELPREIVSASTTLETGELHFKANYLSSSTDTTFRIYYNGVAADYADSDTYGAENVWTNDYVAVYHLEEDPSGGVGAVLDSTRFNHDATGSTTMTSADLVSGKLGYSHDFDGTITDVLISATSTRLANLSPLTICSWYQHDTYDVSGYSALVDKSTDGQNSWNLYVADTDDIGFLTRVGGVLETSSVSTDWQYICATDTGAGGTNGITIYKDGIDTGGTAVGFGVGSDDTNLPIRLGGGMDGFSLDGRMDEVRIASSSRTAEWIKAEYINQSAPTDFYSSESAGVSVVALGNHPLGQIANTFGASDKNDEPMFAFTLTPSIDFASTSLSLGISNSINLDESNLSDWRLYRDSNDNLELDGGDVQVGGGGSFSTTSVSFTTPFLVDSSASYIVTADLTNIGQGDRITISLESGSISAVSTLSGLTLPAIGAVSSNNHLRSKKGGGGGGVNFVNIGAPGNGIETGGTNTGGEELGGEPGFNPPTTSGSPHNEWSLGSSGYLSDGVYASENTSGERQSYSTYGFNIPDSNEITGIEVKLEASATTPAGTIEVALSWDNGSSITTTKTTATLSSTDTIYTLGSPSDLWGRTWVPAEFSNGTFGLRLIGQPSGGNTVQVDAIQIRIYHQAGGGSTGGGSGEL
jgi:ribosomal protein L31